MRASRPDASTAVTCQGPLSAGVVGGDPGRLTKGVHGLGRARARGLSGRPQMADGPTIRCCEGGNRTNQAVTRPVPAPVHEP